MGHKPERKERKPKKNIRLREELQEEIEKEDEKIAKEYEVIHQEGGIKVVKIGRTKYGVFHHSGYSICTAALPKGRALELAKKMLAIPIDFQRSSEDLEALLATEGAKQCQQLAAEYKNNYGSGSIPVVHRLFAADGPQMDRAKCAYCGSQNEHLRDCPRCQRSVCFLPTCRAPTMPGVDEKDPVCIICASSPSYASQDPNFSNGACPICKNGLMFSGRVEIRGNFTVPGNGPLFLGIEFKCPSGHSVFALDHTSSGYLTWSKEEMNQNRMERYLKLERFKTPEEDGDSHPRE
jgi:hypothetical protein